MNAYVTGCTSSEDFPITDLLDVSLRIYNVAGQIVHTLVEGHQPAGIHTATWDGTDEAHQRAASGLYFCRLQAGQAAETIKMVLVR